MLLLHPLLVLGFAVSAALAQLRNVTVDDQNSLFRYTPSASWEWHDDGGAGWDSGGGHSVTADPDAVASINFTFVNFDFVSALYPFAVKTNIFVDGVFFRTVDLQDYNSVNDGSGQSTARAGVRATYQGGASRTRQLSFQMTPGETLAVMDGIIFEVSSSSGGGGSNTGRNVGIALGVVIPIVLGAVAFFLWRWRRRRRAGSSELNGNVHTTFSSTPYSPTAVAPIPMPLRAHDQEKGLTPRAFPDAEKQQGNVLVSNVSKSSSSPHSPPSSPRVPPPPPPPVKALVTPVENPFQEPAQANEGYFSIPASQPSFAPIPVSPLSQEQREDKAVATPPPNTFPAPVQEQSTPTPAHDNIQRDSVSSRYPSTPSSPSSPRLLPPSPGRDRENTPSSSSSLPPASLTAPVVLAPPPKPAPESERVLENKRNSVKPPPRPVQDNTSAAAANAGYSQAPSPPPPTALPDNKRPPPPVRPPPALTMSSPFPLPSSSSSPPIPTPSQEQERPAAVVAPVPKKFPEATNPPSQKEKEKAAAPTTSSLKPLSKPEKKKKESTLPKFKFFRQKVHEKDDKFTLPPPPKLQDFTSDSRSDVGIVGSSAPVAPTPPPEPSDWPPPSSSYAPDLAELGAGAAGVGTWRAGRGIASLSGPPATYISPNIRLDADGPPTVRMVPPPQRQPSTLGHRRMSWNDAALAVVGSPPPSASSPLPPPS